MRSGQEWFIAWVWILLTWLWTIGTTLAIVLSFWRPEIAAKLHVSPLMFYIWSVPTLFIMAGILATRTRKPRTAYALSILFLAFRILAGATSTFLAKQMTVVVFLGGLIDPVIWGLLLWYFLCHRDEITKELGQKLRR